MNIVPARLLGHTNITTTGRHMHLDETELCGLTESQTRKIELAGRGARLYNVNRRVITNA